MNFSSIVTSKELKCSIVHLNKPSVNSYTQTMVQNKESLNFSEEPLQRSSRFRAVLGEEIKANCTFALSSNFPFIILL